MLYYKIVIGNLFRVVAADPDSSVVMAAAEEMLKASGLNAIPDISKCDKDGNPFAVTVAVSPVVSEEVKETTTPVFSDFGSGKQVIDNDAAVRLSGLYDNLEANGITGIARDKTAMGYVPGTRMAAIGYNAQAQRKLDHEGKMPVVQAIEELNAAINNEQRREVEVSSKELINAISDSGDLTAMNFRLTEQAIRGLFLRLNSNGQGLKASGLSRILELQDRIKEAKSLHVLANNQAEKEKMIAGDRAELSHCLRHELARFPEVRLKLRLRENAALNDIFAVLSPSYSVADAPMITPEFLAVGVPHDTKGNWSYDPQTTGWSIDISTWTQTETYAQVVGEPVSGMVSFSGKDNGTGRLNGDGGILIIQCLNASLYSSGGVEVSRVHRGRVLFDAGRMLKAALQSINTLSQAWGNNRKIVVEPPSTLTLEQAMPGFWRALLNKGELVNILPGRKENHIAGLTRTYFDERRDKDKLIRSDVGQAWTKYIQSEPSEIRREAEQAIGNWLVKPTKMLYDPKE